MRAVGAGFVAVTAGLTWVSSAIAEIQGGLAGAPG